MNKAWASVHEERNRQDRKWGEQNHPPEVWLAILTEEVGEVAQAICETLIIAAPGAHEAFAVEHKKGARAKIREEAIHCAAVAMAFVECLDRDSDHDLSNLQLIEKEIREFYESMWKCWYKERLGCSPAVLRVIADDVLGANYTRTPETITIPICHGDIAGYDNFISGEHAEANRWRIWKHELIHQMLHEYRHKMPPETSETGRALMQTHDPSFDGPKHDEAFYTAITEVAKHLNLSPEELRDRIRVPHN